MARGGIGTQGGVVIGTRRPSQREEIGVPAVALLLQQSQRSLRPPGVADPLGPSADRRQSQQERRERDRLLGHLQALGPLGDLLRRRLDRHPHHRVRVPPGPDDDLHAARIPASEAQLDVDVLVLEPLGQLVASPDVLLAVRRAERAIDERLRVVADRNRCILNPQDPVRALLDGASLRPAPHQLAIGGQDVSGRCSPNAEPLVDAETMSQRDRIPPQHLGHVPVVKAEPEGTSILSRVHDTIDVHLPPEVSMDVMEPEPAECGQDFVNGELRHHATSRAVRSKSAGASVRPGRAESPALGGRGDPIAPNLTETAR